MVIRNVEGGEGASCLTISNGCAIMVDAEVIGGVCVFADTCYKPIWTFVVKRPLDTAPPLASATKVFAGI